MGLGAEGNGVSSDDIQPSSRPGDGSDPYGSNGTGQREPYRILLAIRAGKVPLLSVTSACQRFTVTSTVNWRAALAGRNSPVAASGNWRVRTFWVCGVVVGAGVGDQGVDDVGGLVGDGGGDGGLVLRGAVEGVDLERGVDARP